MENEKNIEKMENVNEPAGAEAYALQSLREKIIGTIEELDNVQTLRKVWSILDAEATKKKENLFLSRHIDEVFKKYHNTLTKLAQ